VNLESPRDDLRLAPSRHGRGGGGRGRRAACRHDLRPHRGSTPVTCTVSPTCWWRSIPDVAVSEYATVGTGRGRRAPERGRRGDHQVSHGPSLLLPSGRSQTAPL